MSDPRMVELAGRLPILSDGKRRRFRLYAECFEWTFTQTQRDGRRLNNHYVDREHMVSAVDRTASALWLHLRSPAAT